MRRGPFFLFFFFVFCFSLLKTTKICFGSTKMEIFYREKAFQARKKIRKNDFAPSEKFSCYAPGDVDKSEDAEDANKTSFFKLRAFKLANMHKIVQILPNYIIQKLHASAVIFLLFASISRILQHAD